MAFDGGSLQSEWRGNPPRAPRHKVRRRRRLVIVAVSTLTLAQLAVGLGSMPASAASASVATAAQSATGIYGSGIAQDAKNNYQVGWTPRQRVAYRFRASTTGTVASVAFTQRGGSGYSAGDGGTLKVSIQADSDGKPSGADLGFLAFQPGNATTGWEKQAAYVFEVAPTLTAGQRYHIVFTNVAADPVANYISVNVDHQFLASTPRQMGLNDDIALSFDRGNGWKGPDDRVTNPDPRQDTPNFDIAYADGTHDGNAYFEASVQLFGVISGSSMVRERFTVSGGDRTITTLHARIKRISGNGAVTLTLKDGAGRVLSEARASTTGIPISRVPTITSTGRWDAASLAHGRWVGVTIPATVLRAGSTYSLRISTDSATTLLAIPIREAPWSSRAFRDGQAEKTSTNLEWVPMYEWAPHDLQFYLK